MFFQIIATMKQKKSLQQGIENDHFRLKKNMAKNGYFNLFIQQEKPLKDINLSYG